MGPYVHWVPSDMPLEQAALELASHRATDVPVCTDDGRVVGVLSMTDVAKLYGGATERRLVRDIMTDEILAVRPDDSVERALRTMAHERVHHLLVIDRDDHLLGVVTSMDVLREVAGLPP